MNELQSHLKHFCVLIVVTTGDLPSSICQELVQALAATLEASTITISKTRRPIFDAVFPSFYLSQTRLADSLLRYFPPFAKSSAFPSVTRTVDERYDKLTSRDTVLEANVWHQVISVSQHQLLSYPTRTSQQPPANQLVSIFKKKQKHKG